MKKDLNKIILSLKKIKLALMMKDKTVTDFVYHMQLHPNTWRRKSKTGWSIAEISEIAQWLDIDPNFLLDDNSLIEFKPLF